MFYIYGCPGTNHIQFFITNLLAKLKRLHRKAKIRHIKDPEGNAEKRENRNKSHRQKRLIILKQEIQGYSK